MTKKVTDFKVARSDLPKSATSMVTMKAKQMVSKFDHAEEEKGRLRRPADLVDDVGASEELKDGGLDGGRLVSAASSFSIIS